MAPHFISAFVAGVSLIALAAPAYAQQDAAAQDAKSQASAETSDSTKSANGGDIVVTGSRIVRNGYTAPTPVTVATAEDLVKTTPSSISDALNKLPQFTNSLSPSKSALNFSNAPIHGNVLNLRGLGTPSANPKGPLRTLVLFDGMRVSPTEYVGTVDTNVLPQLLMQRVDVVTGGASAQWGSDAVAGVVNFVLDKNFTGIKGVAQAGVAQRGYAGNQRLGAAYGTDFTGGRGHLLLSGEYSNNDGMQRNDRDFATKGYTYVGSVIGCVNTTTIPTACNPGGQLNPYTIGSDIRISALAPSGRIVASSVTGNPFVGQVINSDGSTRPFNTGTAVGTTGFQSGGDGYTIPNDGTAISPMKTYQAFGRASYKLTDDITAYVQGTWSRTDMRYVTQVNGLVPSSEYVQIYKGNPYLSSALDASLPTTNDYLRVGQYDAGQPKPVAKERTDYWMATAGLNGTLGRFNWSATYSHGSSTHTMANSGLYDNNKLYAAVDAVVDPSTGQVTCRVLLDPTLASQYAGCKPLDVLHGDPSKSTPEGYAYATGTSRYRATIRQDAFAINLSGSLFDLPAGPVDFAVGGEYRHQSLNLTSNADTTILLSTADHDSYFNGLRGVPPTASAFWLTNVGPANGKLNVKEGYIEIGVPILKDKPFFRELGINGAGRITDYSTSGTVKTWKVGATWKPVDDLLLRANLSRDIRAPNLFELYAGPQSGIGIVNDIAIKDPNGNLIYGSGLNQNVNTVTVGNPDLKPEKAKTLTIGGVVTPSFFRGFSLSVDYYRIKVDNLIDSLSAQQIITNCYQAGGSGVAECGYISRQTATSLPSLITLLPRNIAFLKTAGLDIDASYRTPLGNGALGVRLYANYLFKFDSQQYAGAPIAHYAGVSVVGSNPAGYPRWRGNLTIDYSNGPFGVTIGEQYIGKMRLDIPGQTTKVYFVDDHVKPVWYTDLAIRFTVPHGNGNFELFGNINNLFDKKPPLIPGTVPGVNLPTNIAVYDFIGRAFTAGARFKF
ncbi:TonB-dependent receptor domain-containing protein [Flavisphingomonas formosensis]|uniref:TonB-dependent receptor domain-containing protein n=1 Tax=Flavisphingomonas formosensis TaxID=861534 RepID=UPI0012FA6727|nr:TonB-dependent receptor [Sphingomonas formosensis]